MTFYPASVFYGILYNHFLILTTSQSALKSKTIRQTNTCAISYNSIYSMKIASNLMQCTDQNTSVTAATVCIKINRPLQCYKNLCMSGFLGALPSCWNLKYSTEQRWP
jgi:hypothetical protein